MNDKLLTIGAIGLVAYAAYKYFSKPTMPEKQAAPTGPVANTAQTQNKPPAKKSIYATPAYGSSYPMGSGSGCICIDKSGASYSCDCSDPNAVQTYGGGERWG